MWVSNLSINSPEMRESSPSFVLLLAQLFEKLVLKDTVLEISLL